MPLQTMTYSNQSPNAMHLYRAAAQPFYGGYANRTPEFNDYRTQVPPRTKRKRIAYGQIASPTKQRSRQCNDNILKFEGQESVINELKGTIKELHGMDPDYSESDDIESHHAHPQWASNSTFSEEG